MSSVEKIRRILKLVELLQSGRTYNSSMLAELCGVSRRTIFRDLRALEASGSGTVYNQRLGGYRLPRKLLLNSTDFTLEEALSLLVLCCELGNTQTGIPFQRAARDAALKLLSNLPTHMQDVVGGTAELISVRLEPRGDFEDGQHIFELMTRSCSSKRKVRIQYRSLAEEQVISTVVSPYRVVFLRRSWYVIGRSTLHRAVRTFHIGRIEQVDSLEATFEVPPRFSVDRYFGDAWSMIREPGQRHEVVVRFQKMVAHNVGEVRWHKNQKLVWNQDGSLEFHVIVDGLREIMWWILGYGDQAEVLQPKTLRDEVRRRVESMARTYAKPARRKSPTKRASKQATDKKATSADRKTRTKNGKGSRRRRS
jgi:predicted DNA-binding transcriptional regulator YafY